MGKVSVNMGAKEADAIELLPDGTYQLKIVKADLKESKSGNPMVTVDLSVVNSLNHNGAKIMFHNVTIIPNDEKGAWIAKLFLKAIGQPYKGNVTIDTDAWLGKIINAEVGVREYDNKKYNNINGGSVTAFDGQIVDAPKSEEEIPF